MILKGLPSGLPLDRAPAVSLIAVAAGAPPPSKMRRSQSLPRPSRAVAPTDGAHANYHPWSQRLASFGKPGRCTRTTQKRWPDGACITQRWRRFTTFAPSFSRRVDHESRVHIDIETDDIAAEVARWISTISSSGGVSSMR